jgi:hypothetical protein
VIDGAQGIEAAVDLRHHAIPLSPAEQLRQELRCDVRHVASDEQIPFGVGVLEGSIESTERSATLDGVGNDGKAEPRVFFDGSDQRHRSSGGLDFSGDLFEHRCAIQRQQSLVAAHAPTGSARENEPGVGHEMILATPGHIVLPNKKVYICFLVAFAMLAASPSRAADVTTVVVRADARTGKLVRSVIVTARPQTKKSTVELNAIVDKAAKAHNVDPLLVHSIISVESNYNARAVSNKGAQGLMQLTPSTAKMLGVSDSFDPQQNIEAGVKYLKQLKDLYKDDRLALAAYNAGPGAVDKYKKAVPPYAETQNYVHEVGRRYDDAKRAAKPEAAASPVAEVKVEEPKPAPVETFIDENGRLHLKTTQ